MESLVISAYSGGGTPVEGEVPEEVAARVLLSRLARRGLTSKPRVLDRRVGSRHSPSLLSASWGFTLQTRKVVSSPSWEVCKYRGGHWLVGNSRNLETD